MLAAQITLRLLDALNSEDRGLKVHFALATIAFDRESAQMSQMLSSQGKNAPSDPCPHYLVRLAASRNEVRTQERIEVLFSIVMSKEASRKKISLEGSFQDWSRQYAKQTFRPQCHQCSALKTATSLEFKEARLLKFHVS